MRRFIRRLVFGLAAFLAVNSAYAGSYLQSGGDISYSVGAGFFWAHDEWDEDGKLRDITCGETDANGEPVPGRTDYLYNSHYLAYGWSYYYTLLGGVNLARAKCGAEATNGIGDVTLGLRGRLDKTRNHRAWEIELNIPTSSDHTGRTRLGCGAFGLAAGVATKENITPSYSLGAEGRVQFWEAPLSHQLEARFTAAGPLPGPFSWNAGLSGHAPLEDRAGAVATISDCGTQGKAIRGALAIGFRVKSGVYAQCGYTADLWGEDSTRRLGVLCGYTHLFKD